MKVTDQIDALVTLSTNPKQFLVIPVAYRREVSGFGIDADEVRYGQMGSGSAYRLRMLATNYPSPDVRCE